MSIVVMAFLGLLFIFGIVVAYLGARTWYVAHVVLLFFVLLTGGVFLVLAAGALKTHAKWQSEYASKKASIAQVSRDVQRLRYGDPASAIPPELSLTGLTASLRQDLVDRGRVWRGVNPGRGAQGNIVLDMQDWGDAGWTTDAQEGFADEDQPPDPSSQPHGITDGMVLYVFQESQLKDLTQERIAALFRRATQENQEAIENELVSTLVQREACRVPSTYLGQFRVVTTTEQSVTLEPMEPPDEQQQAIIDAPRGSWVLYEVMPIDSHDAFQDATPQHVEALIPMAQTGLSDEAYADLRDEYVRDGQAAVDADLPERVWKHVSFLTEYTVEVDAVADAALQFDSGERDFDSSGLALTPNLRQGEATTFAEDDQAFLDPQTAARLINENVCELYDGEDKPANVYVRGLRDYDYIFQDIALARASIQDQIRTIRFDNAAYDDVYAKATEQIEFRTVEGSELRSDLEQFQFESDELKKVRASLRQQFDKLKNTLSLLYRTNKKQLARLTALHQQIQAAPN